MNESSNSSKTCYLETSSAIALTLVNIIFIILGITGNLLVYFAVYKTPELQTLSNAYLVILASADFLTSSIAQPLLIVMVIHETDNVCDEVITTVFRAVGNFSSAVSFLMLCSITLERFLAVVKPIAYNMFHPKRRFCLLTVISVILPIIYTVIRLTISKKATSYASGALFVIGYIFIVVCYTIIMIQLRRQTNKMANQTTIQDNTSRRQVERSVTIVMAIVVVIFTIMWVPFFYYRIKEPSVNSGSGYNWVRTIAMSNSALNPIVYGLRLQRFRVAFKQLLSHGFRSVFSSTTQTSNATTSN